MPHWIAGSRRQIAQARLLVLHAAWTMDTLGKQEARQEIAMIQVVVAHGFLAVLDRAIQVHGAMGVTNDTPLARLWAHARTLRLVDGPDEVHTTVMARRAVRRWTAGERVERCEGRRVYGGSLLSEGHAGCVV